MMFFRSSAKGQQAPVRPRVRSIERAEGAWSPEKSVRQTMIRYTQHLFTRGDRPLSPNAAAFYLCLFCRVLPGFSV